MLFRSSNAMNAPTMIADSFGWNGAFIFIIVGAFIALLLLALTLKIKKNPQVEDKIA